VPVSSRPDTATGSARTPRGQGDRLRERLLDAGVEIVCEEGDVSHATIRAVTKRAGVSPTAFYLHFPTRDAFLVALRERGFEEFRAAVEEAAATGGEDPAARLQASALGYMRFARELPNVYALIFSPDHSSGEGHWDPDNPGRQAFADLVARVASYLDQAGRERADVERLALALWTGLHGYVTLSHAAQKMDWPADEEFAAQLAEAWLGPAPRGSA
jgi:AcrR family transcriptional regulator